MVLLVIFIIFLYRIFIKNSKTAAWTSEHTTDEVLDVMEKVSVPAGKIYDAKDIVQDEHINARGMIENVTVGTTEEGRGWNVKVSHIYIYIKVYVLIFFKKRFLVCHLYLVQLLDLLNGLVK